MFPPLLLLFFSCALCAFNFVNSDDDSSALSSTEQMQLPTTGKSRVFVQPRQYATACADRHVVTNASLVNVVSGSPGRYVDVRSLGHGVGGALMYAAVDRGTNRPVVLKMLAASTTVESVQRELLMLAQVAHVPDAQHLHDVLLDPHGPPTLVFEQFPIESFATVLARLTLADVRVYAKRLLRLLDAIHSRCIIHGSIAASTVQISLAESSLTVTAWASARHYLPKTKYSISRAEHSSSAPEFLFAVRGYAYGVDLWCAGVLLLEFLTDKPIFVAPTLREQATMVARFAGKAAFDAFVEKYKLELDPTWSEPLWKKAGSTTGTDVAALVDESGRFAAADCTDVINVVRQLLQLDSDARMTAQQAIDALQ
jgi:serine/threonine protein kinase